MTEPLRLEKYEITSKDKARDLLFLMEEELKRLRRRWFDYPATLDVDQTYYTMIDNQMDHIQNLIWAARRAL